MLVIRTYNSVAVW